MKKHHIRAASLIGAALAISLTACSPSGGGSGLGGGPTTTVNPRNGPDCNPPNFVQGANFGGQCDLSNLTISGVDLSPSGTTPTYGPETNLAGTTVIGSNLSYANFKYSSAPGASFLDSDMNHVVLVGSSDTNRSNMAATRWTSVDLSFAELQYADFTDAEFTNVRLEGANLFGSAWQHALLSGVSMDTTTVCPDGAPYDTTDLCRGSIPGF